MGFKRIHLRHPLKYYADAASESLTSGQMYVGPIKEMKLCIEP